MTWLYAQTRSGGRRHPGRAAALLARLALRPPPTIVRVVGTNGKGSVTAMIAHGLSVSGRVTGRYLSPHVEEFRERIAVDGVAISEVQVVDFVARAKNIPPFDDDLHPAFFDWVLALALEHFERSGVVTAVLEAGIGGASDATSVVAAPGVSPGKHGAVELVVLTNVTPEHLDTLGPTLADAARDKAGAFAPGAPAVTGASGEALVVAKRVAAECGITLYIDPYVDRGPGQADNAALEHGLERSLDLTARAAAAAAPLQPDPRALFALPVGLAKPPTGTRAANARLAAAALRLLGASEQAVVAAVNAPPLPGRGERFRIGDVKVLLDGAHDPAAAAALLAEVEPGYVLLFGALRRKQATATLRVLERAAAAVVLTEAAAGEAPPEATGTAGARKVTDPAAALTIALELAAGSQRSVVIAGSLYLAGRLRPLLRALDAAQRSAQPAGL